MTLEELQEMIDEADRDGDGEVNEANVGQPRNVGTKRCFFGDGEIIGFLRGGGDSLNHS